MSGLVTWAKESLRISDGSLVILTFALATALLYLRPKLGRRCLVIAAAAFLFVSTPFGSRVLITPLITGFRAIEDPTEAQGAGAIVVLGGGIRDMRVGAVSFAYPYEGTTLRLLEGARLYRLLGGRVPVVVSGGYTAGGGRTTEAAVMAGVLATLGVPRHHLVAEEQSWNTHEQAMHVTRLLRGRGIERFVLVTAPTHIRRSVAVFRAQHADVVASPAALLPENARRRHWFTPNVDSLRVSDEGVYDYAGIAYYWWRGWLRVLPRDAAK